MDDYILIGGVASSAILLGLFIYLQKYSPNMLKVPAQWVAVAALPIVVALFAGGYITKFSGFGIELETTLKSPISETLVQSPVAIISDIQGDNKESVSALQTWTRDKKLETRYLRFIEGSSAYRASDVAEYLKALPNLYFLEVIDSEGKFVCLLLIDAFVTDESSSAYDMQKIANFVKSIASSNVAEKFGKLAITTTLVENTDLINVLKKMKKEQVKYVGIISPNGQYLGVALQSEIEHQIANSVLSQNKR